MRLPSAGLETATLAPLPLAANTEAPPEYREEIDPLEDLLPKPALDFSHAPKPVDPNDPFNIYRPEQPGAGKREVLVGTAVLAFVIVAGVGAWYKNLLPFLHRAPKASVAADAGDTAKPVGKSDVASAGVTNAPVTGNSAPSATSVTPAPAWPAAVSSTAAPPATPPDVSPGIESPAERAALEEKGAMRVVAPAKSGSKKAAGQPVKNHGKAKTSGESAPVPIAPVVSVSDQPIAPAKLLRAVQPIYPPDAMRNYITGDVRIEAEVDKQGRVGAMKILLGPKQFRQVAMDALRQHEYEPARQGGKPVESKVTVTIKFWFDP
jgi:TonB family protein